MVFSFGERVNMNLIEKYDYDTQMKLKNFEKFIDRQSMARFLVRYELFKKIKFIKGSIIECGVHYGGGLMSWAKLSSALEPYAIHRKIIGFDTFDGFPNLTKEDLTSVNHNELKSKGFKAHNMILEELNECIDDYNQNRFLNQFSKIELIKGDANETIPKYINDNSHLIVSLLFLDFDIYEPTKTALEYFLNRIPKGGIIAFDEINNEYWKGETVAALEVFKTFNNYEIKKFDFDPNIAYIEINK